MTCFTWQDIADAQRDLAASIAAHEAETDPAWKAALADTVEMDREFLDEMLATITTPPIAATQRHASHRFAPHRSATSS